jgi:hypothetical protein
MFLLPKECKMKSTAMRQAAAAMMAALVLTAPGTGVAGSLAGSKGDVRFPVPLAAPDCQKVFKAYVAATSHSAYAQTPDTPMTRVMVCETNLNAPSQKVAEVQALKRCQAVRDSHRVDVGICAIAASK